MSFLINEAFAQSTPPAPGSNTTASTQVASQAGANGAPPQPGALGMLMPFVLMFGVIYVLIIRPQQKKVKEHQDSLGQITHGDEVVTNGGLIGKVTGVNERVLTVEVADGVRVKVLKAQIAAINPDLSAPKSDKKSPEISASR